MVKLDPIVEFREDHRMVRDSLLDLASAAEAVPLIRWADTIRKGQH